MEKSFSDRVSHVIRRYLIVWLCLASLLAYFWPQVGGSVGDPFVGSKPHLWLLIAVTMFAIGFMLPRDEVRQVATRWPFVLGGTAVQYTTMPLLAYGVGRLFALPPETMIGVILVGCVPGAMASNVLTLNARGNVSYSVSLTASATILSPLVVPLVLGRVLDRDVLYDPWSAAWKLLITVVLPVVLGHLVRIGLRRGDQYGRTLATIVANLVIIWIIAVVVGLNRQRLAAPAVAVIVPLLVVNLLGYLAGYTAGRTMRLPEGMRRALTLEVGMQNAGLGTVMATNMFPDQPAAAIAPALYTFGCMLTGTVLARAWAFYSEPAGGDAAASEPEAEVAK